MTSHRRLRQAQLSRTNAITSNEVTASIDVSVVTHSELLDAGYIASDVTPSNGVSPCVLAWECAYGSAGITTLSPSVGVRIWADRDGWVTGGADQESVRFWHSDSVTVVGVCSVPQSISIDGSDAYSYAWPGGGPPHGFSHWPVGEGGTYLPASWFRLGGASGTLGGSVPVKVIAGELSEPAEGEGLCTVGGELRFSESLKGAVVYVISNGASGTGSADLGLLASLSLTSLVGHPVLMSWRGVGNSSSGGGIPLPMSGPLIRLGERNWLVGIAVDSDDDLSGSPGLVAEGTFEWSRGSGQTQFSALDIAKSVPGSDEYELAWLGVRIYWDGVARGARPSPQMSVGVIEDGILGRELMLPYPGVGGIRYVPDGTGVGVTVDGDVHPGARPNGCGLIREVSEGGFIVRLDSEGEGGAIETLKVCEFESDLTRHGFRLGSQVAELALQTGGVRVRRSSGGAYGFVSGRVIVCLWARSASDGIFSRKQEPFIFAEGDGLTFAIDGDVYEWVVPSGEAGVWLAQEVVDSINSMSDPVPEVMVARAVNGCVKLYGSDSVEICWCGLDGAGGVGRGNSVLGFVPGWRVAEGGAYLIDNGVGFNLYRSPQNLTQDRNGSPDYRSYGELDDDVIVDSVGQSPFVRLGGDRCGQPLEDMAGYSETEHFSVTIGRSVFLLANRVPSGGVAVRYEVGRLAWAEVGERGVGGTSVATDVLSLPDARIMSETLSAAAMAPLEDGHQWGLYLQEPGDDRTELTEGADFLLTGSQAQLIERVGRVLLSGGRGYGEAGADTFTCVDADLSSVAVGCLLLVKGTNHVYTITDLVDDPTDTVEIDPVLADADAGVSGVSWEIHEGLSNAVYDPAVLCDVQYVLFNHLKPEPFQVRVLSYLGVVGGLSSANVADAVSHDRPVELRFGLEHTAPTATISYLSRGTELGRLPEGGGVVSYSVPVEDVHFTNSTDLEAYFQLRVGADITYNTSNNKMSLVEEFTEDLAGDVIEVGLFESGIDGQINIGSGVVSANPGLSLYYDQLFLAPSDLAAGESEIDIASGAVNLSEADSMDYAGGRCYLVEELIVSGSRADARISPMSGALYLLEPLRSDQIVEAAYTVAATDGSKRLDAVTGVPEVITEYLPLMVRLETATRVTSTLYTFNPLGKTIDTRIEPQIWVGVNLQNYAGVTTAVVTGSTIEFGSELESDVVVQLNYGVLEAFGGEQSYQVSTPPVYRPPFMLAAGADSFELEGDRTDELAQYQLLLIGSYATYLGAVSYDEATDTTTVLLAVSTAGEVGSRAPGHDVGVLRSSVKVQVAEVSGGSEGFLMLFPDAAYLEVARGATSVVFVGDVSQYAQVGHLLEIGGLPMILTGSSVGEGGRYTTMTVGAPVIRNLVSGTDAVRISVRPIYGIEPSRFSAPYGLLTSEPYELVLFPPVGSTEPGQVLLADYDYALDSTGKNIQLQTPAQSGLVAGSRLLFWYTARRVVSPVVVDGAVVYPVYGGRYLYGTLPSETNGLLGAVLKGKYFYHSPDTFHCQIQTEAEYQAEVLRIAQKKVPLPPAGGPLLTFPTQAANNTWGVLGARGTALDLQDQDDAARDFIVFYDEAIRCFEQVEETIDGQVIGDRSGKFRFFVGVDREGSINPPPGYVNNITGRLNPRVIWREVIETWKPEDATGYYEVKDPVYDPRTMYEPDPTNRPGETNGLTPTPDALNGFLTLQAARVRNDMDDVILTGFGRPVGRLVSIFPRLDIPGVFLSTWEPSVVSRLFPERTKHFSRLFPGVGSVADEETGAVTDPGFFTAGRKGALIGLSPNGVAGRHGITRTRGTAIGRVSNPALGDIEHILDVTAHPRNARARVWAYYPQGDVGLDVALGISTVGKATLVLTPDFLSEFLVDQETGYPDVSVLITNGGDQPDLNSGDPDLSTPGFVVGQQLSYGQPSGLVLDLYGPYQGGLSVTRGGVYVGEVLAGCVITLTDLEGNSLSGSAVFTTDPLASGDVFSRFAPVQGDTVYVPGSQASLARNDMADPPTLEQAGQLADTVGDYRIQFDLKIKRQTGQFEDASLPVEADVWGLPIQEWAGQHPPRPNTTIEGEVDFSNGATAPLELPALLGQARDDAGDVSIPYLAMPGAEKQALANAEIAFRGLFLDSLEGLPVPASAETAEQQNWKAVYPDERALADGALYASVQSGQEPATLYTGIDLTPVATAGSYENNSGLGDLRKFDLLLVQVDQDGVPPGVTGILSVGDCTAESVEPPRFITPTKRGDTHRYTARNLFGSVAGAVGVRGVIITESNILGTYFVTLHFPTVPNLVLDDGSDTGVGGLMSLLTEGGSGNVVTVDFYNPNPLAASGSTYLGSLVLPTTLVAGIVYFHNTAGVATPITLAGAVSLIDSTQLTFSESTASFLTTLGLSAATYYDFTISLDTYVDSVTSNLTDGAVAIGSAPGSTTASVNRDRLTFDERVSFASALPRGSRPANNTASDLALRLELHECPIGAGAVVSTVNNGASINSGAPLTFVTRTYGVGRFTAATSPGAGDELGSIRAMAWEGQGNVALAPLSGIIASPMPSSDVDADSIICEGTAVVADDVLAPTHEPFPWLSTVMVAQGGLAKIGAGDIVVVDGAASNGGEGAVKTGTYLVRHVVDGEGLGVKPLSPTTYAGDNQALDLRFPMVISGDVDTLTLVLCGVPSVSASPTGCGFVEGLPLYLIRNPNYATYNNGEDWFEVDVTALYQGDIVSVTYDAATETAVIVLTGPFTQPDGTVISSADFFAEAALSPLVSGMRYFSIRQMDPELPSNNLVGIDDVLGATLIAGVLCLTAGNTDIPGTPGVSVTWTGGANLERDLDGSVTPTADSIGIRVLAPVSSLSVTLSNEQVVYGRKITGGSPGGVNKTSGVAVHLDARSIDFSDIHFGGETLSPNVGLNCLLPGDRFRFADMLTGGAPGFYAVAGVFLEPSFPRPVGDLSQAVPHVVSDTHPAGSLSQVGIRRVQDYAASGGTSEAVHFYVRRTRRWHGVQADISTSLTPLKYVYEMRVGEFDDSTSVPALSITIAGGTNLGAFNDPLVNIQPGDVFRVVDVNGVLIDSAEIRLVTDEQTLQFCVPGLTQDLSDAVRFQIYLNQPAVPHQQSCEQLLGLATLETLLIRRVDYSDPPDTEGGKVSDFGLMGDESVDWTTSGIQEGDYVLIDPTGPLYTEGEKGQMATGDTSVPVRGAPTWVVGSPSPLDDNRGFYKVTEDPTEEGLTVTGACRFGGNELDGSDNVTFGSEAAAYAVLPVVSESSLTSGTEGQQALRPTAASVAGVFMDRAGLDLYKSIQPFSYRVIRPNDQFSTEALELILFMRERMLSWIQEIQDAYLIERTGSYRVFQLDDHIENLPSPTDKALGLGLWPNLLATSLRGLVGVAPFANVSDCLSILDRRLWINDTKLDHEHPLTDADPYAELVSNDLEQRPVLTDLIDDVLNLADGFRQTRYAWIRFRADRVDGSIVNARRALASLPDRLRRERELAAQQRRF